MKWILAMLPVLLFTLAFNTEANACTCASPPAGSTDEQLINEEFARSDYVFLGRVESRRKRGYLEMNPTFNVGLVEVWKGIDKTWRTIQLENADLCLVDLSPGKKYLFYAHWTSGGKPSNKPRRVFTHNCTRTRSLAHASEDLKRLGPGTKIRPPTVNRPN
jgi:hypothetical protein